MKPSAIPVIGILAAICLAVAGPVRAAEWVFVHSDKTSDFSYDKAGLSRDEKGLIAVSTKLEYTPKGKAEALSALRNPKGYEDLSYTVYIQSIDCQKMQSRLLKVSHYDSKGNEIRTVDLGNATEWEKLLDKSRMGAVASLECGK